MTAPVTTIRHRVHRMSMGPSILFLAWVGVITVLADDAGSNGSKPSPPATTVAKAPPAPKVEHRYNVRRYKVKGGKKLLTRGEIEDAVYPYLGDYVTIEDIENARAALQKAFVAKGYQTVSVEIPIPQDLRNGVVILQVVEGQVERLRVTGSRYFLPSDIKAGAPSLAEGTTPNFNDVTRDIIGLNQDPDRQVTPTIRAGQTPGTVDVDLNVKDKFPLHGDVEIDNRYSADTTPLRVSGTVSYDNLWQLGHSLSFTYQTAPENPNDAKVFTGSYLARIPDVPWLSFLIYGLKSDSDVASVGSINVTGLGTVIGGRVVLTLPTANDKGFFHSFTFGVDYKNFDEGLAVGGGTPSTTPIVYYPFTATYSATWQGNDSLTQLDASGIFDVRGFGSNPGEFDAKRYKADASFAYVKGDLARTQTLPEDFQVFGKVQGQAADVPLVNSEQFSGGGLDTVRGYLESEVLGDDGAIGSFELRSPSLGKWIGFPVDEWRVYGFADAGWLTLLDPLPEQTSSFTLASVGAGTRIKLWDHFDGSLDAGFPLISSTSTKVNSVLLTFKLSASF